MSQKVPDPKAETRRGRDGSEAVHLADTLQNFALRTLIVRAKASGMTKPAFLEAVGLAWESTTPEQVSAVRKLVDWWTSDDG